MMDLSNDNSRGRGVTWWIIGGLIVAILLLLLWKCHGSKGDGEGNEPKVVSAFSQRPAQSGQHSEDTTAAQPAVEASKTEGANAYIVPQKKTREKSDVGLVSSPANATPSPAKEAPTAEAKQVETRVEPKAEVDETETPELAVSYTPISEREVEKQPVADQTKAEQPVVVDQSKVEQPVVVDQPKVEQSVVEQKTAQRTVNADSLREALSDSIRRAMLAELEANGDNRGYNGIALRTNLLYDAALIPTIGAEFDLGKLWSIGFDYNGTWFYSVSRHRYWQTIGGYLTLRRYLKADEEGRPFMGHHFGVYGQLLTFDIEFGDKGWQGAYPNWGGGIEYGYSAWLSNRLNIDFSIGVGYLRLKYKEYDPDGDSFKWRGTYRRNWWGPTKAEVSLKWLLYKRKKHQKANQK